ncbi:hypothetical protein F4803DRAFT_304642 [Xylaria telfairii]|nr:hypothetical protein F4803DRAFT_304642 [Xylaria telfairii]
MGHQESPQPRERHRVPHHRRRRHHHNRHSPTRTTNGKPAFSLGRLNRGSHAPDNHNVVESWLGQLTAPVPTSWLVSPEAQNQAIHRTKSQRSQDRHIFPCSQNPGRVDPLWRPQHIPPAQGSSPPRFPLPTNRERNPKRYKQSSSDSSLISDTNLRREFRELGHIATASKHDEGSHHRPLNESEVDTAGASSPTSHEIIAPTFERRPRHKTKADKYNTKKAEDRKRKGEDKHRPRKSKSNKRGRIVTGKNVMKNFNSEAVLNNRITVPANLKPGLFNNKRVPKEQLITDLSFSEMPFPTHQERDVTQQKGLSSSRLRERRRESRELEQISSFFIPGCTDATSHKKKPDKPECGKEAGYKGLYYRDNKTLGSYRDSIAMLSSPTSWKHHHQRSSTSYENSRLIPTVTAGNPNCRPSSSGTTTYFTWPSSHHSPQARRNMADTRPMSVEPERSATPENIQKALVATGVYKNTGIGSYDVSDDQQNHALETRGESSSMGSSMIDHVKACEGEGLGMKSGCSNDTGAAVALLAHLEARWKTILPPGWKPRRSPEVEVSLAVQQRLTKTPDITSISKPRSHQGIIEQAQIKPKRVFHPDQYAYHHMDHDSRTGPQAIATSPMPVLPEVDQIVNRVTITNQHRDTISSRDAMPPPPIPPPGLDSLHFGSVKLGDDSNASVHLGSAGPVGPHGQIASYDEHAQVMEVNRAIGQPLEVSREPGNGIPTLDSASWIPQTVTSGISSYERDKTLSRLSMRSPIYEIQDKDKDSKGTLRLTPPRTTHMIESMADFIARIESELEEPASFDEYYQPESIIESPGFSLDTVTSSVKSQNRQRTASDGLQMDPCQLAVGVTDLAVKEATETNRRLYERGQLAPPIRERSTTIFTECPRDDDLDEFIEMSNFWRPNRFSYF